MRRDLNPRLFKQQRGSLSHRHLEPQPQFFDNQPNLGLHTLDKALFQPQQSQTQTSTLQKKKYTHKNQYLLAVDDLNLGEEVTFSINSIEQDKQSSCNQPTQISSLKYQKFQQFLLKEQQKKKLKTLSNFINAQMERIMLSKMNSEVQAMYASGHDRQEGTVRDKQRKEVEAMVESIKEEAVEYQKKRKEEIAKKLHEISEFKKKLLFNKATPQKVTGGKQEKGRYVETLVYQSHSPQGGSPGFYTSRRMRIEELDTEEKTPVKFFIRRSVI